jgi:pyruvate dehydrogenase E2 component (dihydrolipoamide acetyltransferase)
MAEIVMPRLSDTMEEGTILRWLKSDGEEVARGEELVEIETDKATMTYESDQAGVLEIVASVGDTLAVGEVIARVGGDGPSVERKVDMPARPASVRSEDAKATRPTAVGARVKASPLARRIARESGIDLGTITGSGPGGRIVKADVQASGQPAAGPSAPASGATPYAPAAEPTPEASYAPTAAPPAGASLEGVATAKGETSTVELNRTQQAVARRMAESKATIPDFSLQVDVDMEACVTLRGQLKELRAHEVPTYNDMVVKAAALALREYARANGSYRDGRLQLYSRVNVGVAVAAQDALVVPTVFDADEKSLGEIARETRALAERVRAGTITPPELGGGTFTVSNLGMYGVRSFTAIINPPQAGILSVGALAQRAVVHEGELAARHTMTLTLACDHRILYGAEAAQFLARVRELLEAPASLTL